MIGYISCRTSLQQLSHVHLHQLLPEKQPSIFPRSFRICITALLAAYHRCCLACLFSLAVHRPGGRPITVFVYRCYSLASALSLTQLSLSDSFMSLNTRWLGCKDTLGCVEGRRGGLVFFSDPTQSCNTSATFWILVFTATFCFLHRLARGMDPPGRLSELGYIGVFIVGWRTWKIPQTCLFLV